MTPARKLTPVIPEDDPLWRKFVAAPFDPNPPSEQELRWLEQAGVGPTIAGADISAEIARRAERETESDRS